MKAKQMTKKLAFLGCLLGAAGAQAQTPDIVSFRNGELVWTNSAPESAYEVQWSPSLLLGEAGWRSNYVSLTEISAPPSAAFVTSAVPMFYRVKTAAPAAPLYTLTVFNGLGSGSYASGEVVSVAADYPGSNQVFLSWTGNIAGMANPAAPNTTVTILGSDATVTATYTDRLYALNVYGGSGSGSFASGTTPGIVADAAPAHQIFDRWTGDTAALANAFAASTTVAMPGRDVAVTATYSNRLYTLTVEGGDGDGFYAYGQSAAITADLPSPFKAFDRWIGATQGVADVWSASTALTMPGSNVAVTATYVDVSFALSVYGGSGSGSYTNQQVVPIVADPPPPLQTFDRWTGATQTVANVLASNTTVQIPGADVALIAAYKSPGGTDDGFTLAVLSGSGDGQYTNGQTVAIAAEPSPYFRVFDSWVGDTGTVAVATNASTTLVMPGTNAAVAATYFWSPVPKTLPADPTASGIPWPTNRFTVGTGASSNCVLDNLTGLTWMRNPPATLRTWASADSYCLNLDGTEGRGGYDDWRMPNIREQLSLVDFRYYAPCLGNTVGDAKMTSGNPFMNIGTSGYYYWTSTSHFSYWRNAWAVSFTYGDGQSFDKLAGSSCQVFPVRGGLQNK